MEALELPELEEPEEAPPINFTDQEIDLAAFRLWREASRPSPAADGEEPA